MTKNKSGKMDLDIQLFAEVADNAETENVDEVQEDIEEDGTGDAASEVEETPEEISKKETKAYSERLNLERKKIKEELEEQYKEKLNNTAKLRGFDTWDEFDNAVDSDALLDAGVSDVEKLKPVLQTMISKNPEVLKAKEIIENAEKERKEKLMNDEIILIHEIDPDINSIEDIQKNEKKDLIIDKVKRGYSLYDAYVTTNYEKIQGLKVQTEKHIAASNTQSKAHMKSAAGAAGDSTIVPDEIIRMYHRNLPKWTNEQIQAHYEKTIKEDTK